MNTKKYYFLPFLDNLLAVLLSLLFTVFFGSWFHNPLVGTVVGIAMTLVMCGFVYSRMWKLSRKNARYHWGLPKNSGMKFMLPLVIVSAVLVMVYFLTENGILPFGSDIIKTYYTFPDNAPRQAVYVTSFDYFIVLVRFWFAYLIPFSAKMHFGLFAIAPVLMFVSGTVGFHFGAENKEMLEKYIKASEAVKKKFND